VARLAVSDTGIGIPAGEQAELFTRFFRASTARRNAVPGVGLGLTITKAITTAHGGTLDVVSVEGRGTTFTLTLPRATA
jgi:signal transduction histidine kinase